MFHEDELQTKNIHNLKYNIFWGSAALVISDNSQNSLQCLTVLYSVLIKYL